MPAAEASTLVTDRAKPRLLIVHHTPTPALHTLFEAVRDGARDPQLSGVEVTARPALGATASDVLAADGLVLGTRPTWVRCPAP